MNNAKDAQLKDGQLSRPQETIGKVLPLSSSQRGSPDSIMPRRYYFLMQSSCLLWMWYRNRRLELQFVDVMKTC